MRRIATLAVVVLGATALSAQQINFGMQGTKHQDIMLLSDSITIAAGRPDTVELRFRVEPGLHVNSHTPKDQLLLPTTLNFTPSPAVSVLGETFPAGQPLHLAIGAGEMLSVYEGEFRVSVRLKANAGDSTLNGALHYQACDEASCLPPRTLPLKIAVSAR